ncbi:PLD nuclease N-terminal domain-containing protein [Marinilongibacter aquaticus]|uniref:PLD nuclease N-terminal domain-containing protein n=1 Tax=Marinilongibacter aquaticus TaxID=2975157 RepID=UPI0021BDD486|nr:PLD nuclease N-terminal domain-containing protein [Marinilongibacter aquaticus]UBM60531.1 PLD nuclease N-terminal domain-containing protein [Marinilongibacter aquaticus]
MEKLTHIFPLSLMISMLVPLALFIWALIDLVKAEFRQTSSKLVWFLVVLLIPFVGSILYLVIGRKQKIEED